MGGQNYVFAIAKNVGTGLDSKLLSSSTGNDFVAYQYAVSGASKGFDPGLTKRCVASPGAHGSVNYFHDRTDCPGDPGSKPSPAYQLAIQSEATLGQTCAGIINQSLPIHGWDSGVMQFYWTGSGASLTANLKTDVLYFTHPCTQTPVWNWYMFGDHAGNNPNGPFPTAARLGLSVSTAYSDWLPSAASRFMAFATGFWKESVAPNAPLVAHDVYINMIVSDNWGDDKPNDPQVFATGEVYNPQGVLAIRWIDMRGDAMGWVVPRDQLVTWSVHFGNVFKYLVARGYFPPPVGSTDWSNATSAGAMVGTEFMNSMRSGAGSSWISISGFRIKDASP